MIYAVNDVADNGDVDADADDNGECYDDVGDAGKIEMVKSKWGLALSAMITVFASLLMSVSLCVFFGLTPSLSGRFASKHSLQSHRVLNVTC